MRSFLLKGAVGLSLWAVAAAPTSAQYNEPVVMDQIMVTASRLPMALEQTPGNTTVLTREDIEALAPTTAADLLRMLPGVHLTSGGGSGSPGFVHMRGADPNFTAVYIDGVLVNDPTDNRGGSFDFNSLDPSEIEKIEILRGPLSSVHGSSAVAGAISILTRRRDESEIWARLEGGSDELLRASIGNSRAGEDWERQIRLSHSSEGEVVPGNDFKSQSMDLSLKEKNNTLSLRLNRSKRKSFPDTSGGPLHSVIRDVETENIDQIQLHLASERTLSERGSLCISLGGFQKDSERESPGIEAPAGNPFGGIPAGVSDGRYRRGDVEVNLVVGDATEELVLGAALSSEDGESEGILYDAFGPGGDFPTDFRQYRRVGSVYLEGLRDYRRLTLQTSLRLDAPDDQRAEWSPRLGARHRLRWGGGALKANWGESFKLASLYALGDPLIGDPTLENETGRGWDVAWVQPLLARRLEFELGWYENRFENLIDLEFSPGPRLVNRTKVDIVGVEVALRARPSQRVSVDAQLSQSRSEIHGTADVLQDRPEWTASLHARWMWENGHSVGLKILHIGSVPDESNATGFVELDAYTRVDLSARYSLGQHWSAIFALDNILDARYEEAVGFESHGFRPRVGVSLR